MKSKIIDGILIEWAGQEIIAATAENSRPLEKPEIPQETLNKWNTVKNQISRATRNGRHRRCAIAAPDRQDDGGAATARASFASTTAPTAITGT